MKKFVALLSVVMLIIAVSGPAFAQQTQAPKGTEGPDIKKQEPKGTEGPDIRKKKTASAPKPKVEPKGTEGPGIRKQEPKGTEGPDIRKDAEKKTQ